jgi:thioredoxin 1
MNRLFARKWKRFTLAGLLSAAGVLATAGCMFNRTPAEKSISKAQPTKKETMSIAQQRPAVLHANQANFDEQVLNSDVPVLVDFYADWCGPCKRLAPVLEELAAETPNARIVKVNIEHSPELAAQYGVESIPSLKVFKNGRVTDQVVGLAGKDRLQAMLTR